MPRQKCRTFQDTSSSKLLRQRATSEEDKQNTFFVAYVYYFFIFPISSALTVPLYNNPIYSPEAAKRFLLAQGNKKE
jgi:hypothetical protein